MNEPIAYAAVAADGSESVYVASLKEQAEACCRENGWQLVPLYAAVHQSWQLVHENERLRDEIERLKQRVAELVYAKEQLEIRVLDLVMTRAKNAMVALTDAERAAVEGAILHMESRGVWAWPATLRGLLERLK